MRCPNCYEEVERATEHLTGGNHPVWTCAKPEPQKRVPTRAVPADDTRGQHIIVGYADTGVRQRIAWDFHYQGLDMHMHAVSLVMDVPPERIRVVETYATGYLFAID